MNEKKTYLTPAGKEKLLEELEYLRTTRRAEVAAQIKFAKEGGDISENAGYDEAKNAQAFLEGRIMTLEQMIETAVIIDQEMDADSVQLGVFVSVREDGEAQAETYQIVGSAEADPKTGRISNESPMGKAMLGKKVGERFSFKTPGGERRMQIIKLSAKPH